MLKTYNSVTIQATFNLILEHEKIGGQITKCGTIVKMHLVDFDIRDHRNASSLLR